MLGQELDSSVVSGVGRNGFALVELSTKQSSAEFWLKMSSYRPADITNARRMANILRLVAATHEKVAATLT